MKTTTHIVLMGVALFIFQNISFAQIQSGSFEFEEYTDMNSMADTAGFIAVYPDAVYPGFNDGGTYLSGDVNDVG